MDKVDKEKEIERVNEIIDDLKRELDKIKYKISVSKDSKIDLRDRIVELTMENEALKNAVKQLAKMVTAKEEKC